MVSINVPVSTFVKNTKEYGKLEKHNMHLRYSSLTLKDKSFPLKFKASNIKTRSRFTKPRTFYGELVDEGTALTFRYSKGATELKKDSFRYNPDKCCQR